MSNNSDQYFKTSCIIVSGSETFIRINLTKEVQYYRVKTTTFSEKNERTKWLDSLAVMCEWGNYIMVLIFPTLLLMGVQQKFQTLSVWTGSLHFKIHMGILRRWDRTMEKKDESERLAHICGQLTVDQCPRDMRERRSNLFYRWGWDNWSTVCKKKNELQYLIICKNQLKIGLRLKPMSTNLEENVKKGFCKFGLCQEFLIFAVKSPYTNGMTRPVQD